MYKRQAYIHASKEVAKLADTLEGDEKTGAKVILKALEAPLYYISANAGLEGAVIINKDVYKRQLSSTPMSNSAVFTI